MFTKKRRSKQISSGIFEHSFERGRIRKISYENHENGSQIFFIAIFCYYINIIILKIQISLNSNQNIPFRIMANQRRQINSIPKDKVPNLNNLPHSFKKEKFKCVQKGTDVSYENAF